jgi:hypothetical protein
VQTISARALAATTNEKRKRNQAERENDSSSERSFKGFGLGHVSSPHEKG